MGSRPVTIAVLVLAHANPAQLKRLVSHLQADFDVFVHLDKRSDILASDFAAFTKTKVIKKVKATWGSLGIVRATLELLELASGGTGYDRYVLISGQDVPLKTNSAIAEFFSQHREIDFVDSNPFTNADESRLTRISRFHFFPRRTFSAALTTLAADISRRLDELIFRAGVRRSMNYGFRWGSQWMDLTSETADKVLLLVRNDKGFLKRFHFTFCPDEVFFQTAIESCGRQGLSLARPRRYIDWQTGPEHPRVLRQEDLGAVEASDMLFARKCDTSIDPDFVEALYARLNRTD